MKIQNTLIAVFLVASGILFVSCSMSEKLSKVRNSQMVADIYLADEADVCGSDNYVLDTIVQENHCEAETIIMRAVKDDNGDMIATDIINAAVIEAGFRNVAERRGKVDIKFRIRVPRHLFDKQWQLRFFPEMYIGRDTLLLEPVIITGQEYRDTQLRGYQRYNKFLSSIVTDSSKFIHIHLLELFIRRNIPELYAFRTDSSIVSDARFSSVYGVTEQDAIRHYTNGISKKVNSRKMARKEKVFNKYIKVPINYNRCRLDSVVSNLEEVFLYDYTQTVQITPSIRKIDVVLSGEIYEQDRRLYSLPRTGPLTFYISSLATLADDAIYYKNRSDTRKINASTSFKIDFDVAESEVNPYLNDNAAELERIKDVTLDFMKDKRYEIDSIVVTASCSPEGSLSYNSVLSKARSITLCSYFKNYLDSLKLDSGGDITGICNENAYDIKFVSRENAENWNLLDELVGLDSVLTFDQKRKYIDICEVSNLDEREYMLREIGFYDYLYESLFPELRKVELDFHMHHKGMERDETLANVIDEEYMSGVRAIKDRDYKKAVSKLCHYNDYNAALAYCAAGQNINALSILENLPVTDKGCYLLAVVYSRLGQIENAINRYGQACRMNGAYVHRGNLDPEISVLIKKYNLKGNEIVEGGVSDNH